jgi:hypothetical protein
LVKAAIIGEELRAVTDAEVFRKAVAALVESLPRPAANVWLAALANNPLCFLL